MVDQIDISDTWTNGREELLFTWAWTLLMQPSKALDRDIIALRDRLHLTGDYIAVQIRRGGHWSDGARHEDIAPFADCVGNVTEVIGDLPVYIATDDLPTRRQFANLTRAVVGYDDAEPYHVTQNGGLDLPRLLRTWTEFYMIKDAACVVASRSGFSEWPIAISRQPRVGSRCYARFDRCSVEDVARSRSELVAMPIWPDRYPYDSLTGCRV